MLETLSPREKELFDLLLKGVSPKEIAHNLNLKSTTVGYYRTNLYNKLGVHSIQELLVKYSTNGEENTPELTQSEKTINIPQTKKRKKFKFLLPVGAVFIFLSVLFVWIFIKKTSANHTPKGIIIPVNNLGFFPMTDVVEGGNSTSEVFITREEIDGASIDVLNIKINLVKRETISEGCFANANTRNPDLIQQLRQANGIRFKAKGDGKQWALELYTKETTAEDNYPHYTYMVNTVMDQIIVVDVPYSSLYLDEYYYNTSFDFNKETINTIAINANLLHGYGPSLLQIFDFEIY
jgi:DNA-binding CsgD family transcriptional regulator